MLNDFESTKEFNEVWEDFCKKNQRESWKMPKCFYQEQMGIRYFNTARFRWIVETFELWLKWRRIYLDEKELKNKRLNG